jgi:hypothetical protein
MLCTDQWDSEIPPEMELYKVDSKFNQRSKFPFSFDYELLVGVLFGNSEKGQWILQIRQYTYFSGQSSWFVKGNTTTYWINLFNDTPTSMSFHFLSHQGFQNRTIPSLRSLSLFLFLSFFLSLSLSLSQMFLFLIFFYTIATHIDAANPKCAQGQYFRDLIVLFSDQNVALFQARLSDFFIPHANYS